MVPVDGQACQRLFMDQQLQIPITGLSAEDFVSRLYTPLAWDAAVQLGDVVAASRLVERALQRAWEERDRFATTHALFQHSEDAARDTVARERQRRLDLARIDGVEGEVVVDDRRHLTPHAVVRRLSGGELARPERPAQDAPGDVQTGRANSRVSRDPEGFTPREGTRPGDTPTTVPHGKVGAPPLPRLAAELTEISVAPPSQPTVVSPAPAPAEGSASSVAVHREYGVGPRALRMAKSEPLRPITDAPRVMPVATEPQAAARPLVRAGVRPARQPRERPHLKSAGIIAQQESPRVPRRVMAVVGGVLVIAVAAWAMSGGESAEDRALSALAVAPTGVTASTQHRDTFRLALGDGSFARLGADASVKAAETFSEGPRTLTLSGPVALTLQSNEEHPVAISAGAHRWITSGGVLAFSEEAGRVLLAVDSGVVHLVLDTARVEVVAGSAMAVNAGGAMAPLDDAARSAAFGWRRDRLQLREVPLQTIREKVLQWFDVDVQLMVRQSPAAVASVDVPLSSVDSLVAALETVGQGRAVREGKTIVVGAAPRPVSAGRPRAAGNRPLNIQVPKPVIP